ncbi:MAG: 30S ribosomal protein S4 [Bacilli bacterium]
MSRYIGPVYKKSRRLKFSILETGKELARKPNAPGIHGTSRKKLSEYGLQLQEKQKVRNLYGLNERQFRKTFDEAGKIKGIHGTNLLILLESRIDNLTYRLGFAKTRKASRQLVNHGHITVNGKKVDIPSYRCKIGDVIGINQKSLEHPVILENLTNTDKRAAFVSWDDKKKEGTYVRFPEREELNIDINEAQIVEYYNR